MCNLTVHVEKKIEGYKIVAKKLKGKRYFSITIGFKYPLDGHVPIARKQRRICSNFMSDILSKTSGAYRENMTGRTAIFLSLVAASKGHYSLVQGGYVEKGYELIVVRSEVSVDVMEGTYFTGLGNCKVAAGRHINFIEEVEVISEEED